MVETGETIRSTRKTTGVSLDEVSKDLEIPVLVLEQIEDGAFGAFDDIYEAKRILVDYAKYLGLNTDEVVKRFNEYMFDYTSKIPMAEIEKAVREQQKEHDDTDRIASPYTRVYPKEKTLPYILTGIGIVILVILAVLWSISQITVNNISNDLISYFK